MFITIKARPLMFVFALLLVIGLCGVCVAVKEAYDDVDDYSVSAVSQFVVLIDAGHGGEDGGATANGLTEKDINLSVAKKLKTLVEESGGKAIMTREEDVSVADENRDKKISFKQSDLSNRKKMIKNCNADIFVSIHMNKFPEEKYWGSQVFYADKPQNSQKLGEAIQNALFEVLNDGNTRKAKKADSKIFILKNAEVPSVIVECGFLSNNQEAEKLKTDEYQQNLAAAVFKGICDYADKHPL